MMERASHDSEGGYNYNFLNPPVDRVVCVICHLPSRDAHLTECCGHVLCKSCLDKLKTTQYKACPMCKGDHFFAYSNKQIDREVRSLHVYCTNKQKGCRWQGELKNIRSHIGIVDGCRFEEIECTNECGKKLERRHLSRHVKIACQHRKIECQYCHEEIKWQFVDGAHLEECPKLPLPCPNNCKKAGLILREDMEAHRKECPLEMIQCEYHNVGCEVKMLRKRRKQHEDDKMKEHLRMTSTKLAKTEDRVSYLELIVHRLMGKTVNLNPPISSSWSVQLSAMESMRAYGSQVCPVVLRITNYSHGDCGFDWYSSSFCSHFKGYTMQLNVDVPEIYDESPAGIYVSVGLYLLQGLYDDEVTWPLKAKFEVTLLNQISDSEHRSATLTFDETLPGSTIYRVIDDDDENTPVRHDTFISMSDMYRSTETCQFLRDHCLFFRVSKVS